MKIPKEFKKGTPKKMTDAMIEEGKRLLLLRYSERFVAKQLGVSRSTVRIHCVKGWKETFRKKYKTYKYQAEHGQKDAFARNALRRYKILSELYPEEMKVYRKKRKDAMGKEYFRNYMKNYRNSL